MDNLPIKTFDVLSFTGLIALIPFLLEGFKSLLKTMISGREPWVCMILTYAIGVPVKLVTPNAYNGLTGPMGWIVTIVGLFLCGVAAMQVHDNVLAKMFGWRDDVLSKPSAPGGGPGGAP
jgi:hypothetical protein